MKKLWLLLCSAILFVSCVSTKITYYSDSSFNGNKVFLRLDEQVSTIQSGSIGYTSGFGVTFMSSSSETFKLGTIQNKEKIRSILESKGYQVVSNIEEADIIMSGDCGSNGNFALVTFGIYDKQSDSLLFLCEGKYGLGWSAQDDLNKAVDKALESMPAIK